MIAKMRLNFKRRIGDKNRKKTRSIARRINLSQVADLFAAFLVVDIIVLWIYAGHSVDVHAWGVNVHSKCCEGQTS